MHELPPGAPAELFDAFAHIMSIDEPTVDDLKLMVILEAAGKALYDSMAEGVADEQVKALLLHNGREELAHAHRVSRAIGRITKAEYPVPEPSENPYLVKPIPPRTVDKATLANLASAEMNGEALYEKWARSTRNPEAAALMRQNGREETEHGQRLQKASELLPA